MSTGNKIKNIRYRLGLSQQGFADLLNKKINDNFSKGTVNNWEKERNLPNNKRLKAIAEIGDTTIFELLNDGEKGTHKVGPLNKNIVEVFENRRKELHIKKSTWANYVGISTMQLSRYEKRNFINIKDSFLNKSLEILNISPRVAFDKINFFESYDDYKIFLSRKTYIDDNISKFNNEQINKIYNAVKDLKNL
ncbi:helix-turn-helix transcriptional regulator [Apilactobacillus quenuiae]|uniref:helix-turn-helix transcriptional regulator n=1 Tax=Apilactobacillus quenuiae TaxID=2008377 RepID=UPI000D526C77|nr:helix-turn-helix domain-containing protein [Apilactobacillus quenuiae]